MHELTDTYQSRLINKHSYVWYETTNVKPLREMLEKRMMSGHRLDLDTEVRIALRDALTTPRKCGSPNDQEGAHDEDENISKFSQYITSKIYRRSKGGMNSRALCIQEHERVKQKSGALETIQAKYFANWTAYLHHISSCTNLAYGIRTCIAYLA